MIELFTAQNFSESRELLTELFTTVSAQENTLAGGEELGTGGEAIKGLLETEVRFGNPRGNLKLLTDTLAKKMGVKMTPIQKEQMDNSEFNFYYMTLPVSIVPKRGARFMRIITTMQFGPKGLKEPIVHSIFPTNKSKDLLSLGVGLNLFLGSDLKLDADLSGLTVAQIQQLPIHLQAKIVNKDHFRAFVSLPTYTFTLGQAEIVALGEESSDCLWSIEKFNLQEAQTVTFVVVFKVPLDITAIDLIASAAVEPNINWLVNCVRSTFKYLTRQQQASLSRKDENRKGKEHFPIGKSEQWTLELSR